VPIHVRFVDSSTSHKPLANTVEHLKPSAGRKVATRQHALRPEHATSPPKAISTSKYIAASELDVAPVARSTPDESVLIGIAASGLPVRLRVYVGSEGTVSHVEVLQGAQVDDAFADAVRSMLIATAFVPGRRAGIDVASYLDVEVVPAHEPASAINVGL
jgi:hypothetical protein